MRPVTLQSRDLFCSNCYQLARKESNLRPASYKDAALTAELRASSWVGGIRTHTSLIKSQVCSRYTTEPRICSTVFELHRGRHFIAPGFSSRTNSNRFRVVALRIELSVTTLSGSSGQPVLDYRSAGPQCARTLSAVGNWDSTCRLSYERKFGERARPL